MTQLFDAHVHFWYPPALRYPWLEELPALNRPFLPRQFSGFAENAVSGALFVEANCDPSQFLGEVGLIERLRRRESRIAGIVAFMNLLDEPARAAALDRLQAVRTVVGVRQNIQGHSAGIATSAAFMRGVDALGARGLTFDVCVTEDQLAEVATLADSVDATRLIIDHCGKPAVRTHSFGAWAAAIERLAAHDNVSCKVSGLLSEATPHQRSAAALRPYVEHVRSCFGASRLLYGSDWPVVTLAGGEPLWRAVVTEIIEDWPVAEQNAFLWETALTTYGLTVHHTP